MDGKRKGSTESVLWEGPAGEQAEIVGKERGGMRSASYLGNAGSVEEFDDLGAKAIVPSTMTQLA